MGNFEHDNGAISDDRESGSSTEDIRMEVVSSENLAKIVSAVVQEEDFGGNEMEAVLPRKSYQQLVNENEKLRQEMDLKEQQLSDLHRNYDVIIDENALISLEMQRLQRMALVDKSKLERDLQWSIAENKGLQGKVDKLKGGLQELSQLMFEAILQLNSNAIISSTETATSTQGSRVSALPALGPYPVITQPVPLATTTIATTKNMELEAQRCQDKRPGGAINFSQQIQRCLTSSIPSKKDAPPTTPAAPPQQPKNNELLHKPDTKRTDGFFCTCGASLSSKQSLRTHIRYFTANFAFSCNVCSKRCWTTSLLKAHLKNKHGIQYKAKGFGCRRCGHTFSTRSEVGSHYKTVHNGGSMTRHQPSPSKALVTRANYQTIHLFRIPHALDTSKSASHPGDKSVYCVCGRRFITSQYLQMHINHYSKEPHFRCQVCGKLYYKAFRLTEHMKRNHKNVRVVGTHSPGSPKCMECNLTFGTRMAFNQHVKKEHGQGPAAFLGKPGAPPQQSPVVLVEKLKTPKRQRKIPMKLQDQEPSSTKRILCPVSLCSRIFSREDYLKSHLIYGHKFAASPPPPPAFSPPPQPKPKKVKKPRPTVQPGGKRHGVAVLNVKYQDFQCLCGQQFKRQDTLRDHIRLKMGLSWFTCTVCGQAFKRHDYMKKHMERYHDLQKNGTMACRICGMGGFITGNDVKKHRMTHHKNAAENDPLLRE